MNKLFVLLKYIRDEIKKLWYNSNIYYLNLIKDNIFIIFLWISLILFEIKYVIIIDFFYLLEVYLFLIVYKICFLLVRNYIKLLFNFNESYLSRILNILMFVNTIKNPILYIYIILHKYYYFFLRYFFFKVENEKLRKICYFIINEGIYYFILRMYVLYLKFFINIQEKKLIEIFFFRLEGFVIFFL